MRTSHVQYIIMVEFMERYGDLSKPTGGPRGRHFIQIKWKELTEKLNSEGTGDPRPEEKWRKVWSDLKNNTKKKMAKINKAASGTGGGPVLQLSLTDLEDRVMAIIGVQAATGMVVAEAGFQQDESVPPTTQESLIEDSALETPMSLMQEDLTGDWNTPGTSSQPTITPSSREQPVASPPGSPIILNLEEEEHWTPPPKKKKPDSSKTAELFLESDRLAREYARERATAYERLEAERLRVQEQECRERVRQRDMELNLQAQWLEFMKEALNIIVKYLEKDKDNN